MARKTEAGKREKLEVRSEVCQMQVARSKKQEARGQKLVRTHFGGFNH